MGGRVTTGGVALVLLLRPPTPFPHNSASCLLFLQLYSELERQVLLPGFAEDLARSQHELQQHPASPQQQPPPAAGSEGGEVLAQDWWELHEDGDLRGECGKEGGGGGASMFVGYWTAVVLPLPWLTPC